MKKLFLVKLFLIINFSSMACLNADQNRLFPIGFCSKGLVVVEMHLSRWTDVKFHKFSSGGKEMKVEELIPVWGGISYLNIYDKNYVKIESGIFDTLKISADDSLDIVINLSFKKGLEIAKEIKDLILAEPISLSFYGYKVKSKEASFESDIINIKAFIKLQNKKKYEVKVLKDSSSIASNYLDYLGGFDYESSEQKEKSIIEVLLINSVRKFKIGDMKLTVVHLGIGGSYEGDEDLSKMNKDAKFQFSKIENTTFEEPLLHHGHGFDFFIIE